MIIRLGSNEASPTAIASPMSNIGNKSAKFPMLSGRSFFNHCLIICIGETHGNKIAALAKYHPIDLGWALAYNYKPYSIFAPLLCDSFKTLQTG